MAVVAALKLDDVFALGEGPRQPNRGHGGLGSRADETYLLHRGEGLDDLLGQLRLNGRAGAKAGAVAVGLLNPLHHGRKGVPQNQRPPRADIVDVLIAVGIVNARTMAAHNIRWVTAHRPKRPYRRIDSARNYPARTIMKLKGFFAAIHGN